MKTICFFLLFVSVIRASDRVNFEWEPTREQVPNDWQLIGPSEPQQKIRLTFAVRQQNTDKLLQVFNEVSDPKNPNYGRHWTNEKIHELLAPSQKDLHMLTSYIRSFNATPIAKTPNSDFLEVLTTIEIAERLLQTKYYTFHHKTQKTMSVNRAPFSPYSLPAFLSKSVDFVSPTIRFPPIKTFPILKSNSTSKIGINTPTRLRSLYSVNNVVGSSSLNSQAVTAFLGQFYSDADENQFFQQFFPQSTGQALTLKGDAPTGTPPGVEAMLDAEYIVSLGASIHTEFWGFSGSAPDNPDNEPFLTWLELVSSTPDSAVPKLFSTSYGEDEQTTTLDYSSRINIEFQKAGARGISLLFSTGDSGAGGASGCINGEYVPKWPGGSPYITAVGGTQGGSPETAIGLGSGGFSNRYSAPTWQQTSVNAYLVTADNLPPSNMFNKTGRAFPDVSAQASEFPVVCNGQVLPTVAGTSCSCPTVGGIFGLLNDLRLQNGKSTLGFLNPLIYSYQAAFNDITVGFNDGCTPGSQGFPASQGWDAATGVGTPNYQKLAKVVLSLP